MGEMSKKRLILIKTSKIFKELGGNYAHSFKFLETRDGKLGIWKGVLGGYKL